MKKTLFLLLFAFTINAFSVTYNVTLATAVTSARNTIDSIQVYNSTTGGRVTWKAGDLMQIVISETSLDPLSGQESGMRVAKGATNNNSIVSFDVSKSGSVQLNVYGIDGRKVAGVVESLQQGNYSFNISLPQGVFIIKAQGQGFAYSQKVISQTNCPQVPTVALISSSTVCKMQKSKAANVVTITGSLGDAFQSKAFSLGYVARLDGQIPPMDFTAEYDFQNAEDIDGNVYNIVTLNRQKWMTKALRTTRYRNGEDIPELIGDAEWAATREGAFCENLYPIGEDFGYFYNYYTIADIRNIAPVGWHVASDAEWLNMTNYVTKYKLGTSPTLGKALTVPEGWNASTVVGAVGCDTLLNNSTGLSITCQGYRDALGVMYPIGDDSQLWTSTRKTIDSDGIERAYTRHFNNNSKVIFRETNQMTYGASIRCVMDTQ